MNTLISRSPNDAPSGTGIPGAQSRVSAGIPRAPLRSARPPAVDPADQSTLDMLGSNPLSDPNASLGNAATGAAGFLMGSMAAAAKGIQGLAAGAPGFVPPEILMWVDNAMQTLPQLIQQMQSPNLGVPNVAGTPPPQAPGMGMPAAPMAPGVGGAGMPM